MLKKQRSRSLSRLSLDEDSSPSSDRSNARARSTKSVQVYTCAKCGLQWTEDDIERAAALAEELSSTSVARPPVSLPPRHSAWTAVADSMQLADIWVDKGSGEGEGDRFSEADSGDESDSEDGASAASTASPAQSPRSLPAELMQRDQAWVQGTAGGAGGGDTLSVKTQVPPNFSHTPRHEEGSTIQTPMSLATAGSADVALQPFEWSAARSPGVVIGETPVASQFGGRAPPTQLVRLGARERCLALRFTYMRWPKTLHWPWSLDWVNRLELEAKRQQAGATREATWDHVLPTIMGKLSSGLRLEGEREEEQRHAERLARVKDRIGSLNLMASAVIGTWSLLLPFLAVMLEWADIHESPSSATASIPAFDVNRIIAAFRYVIETRQVQVDEASFRAGFLALTAAKATEPNHVFDLHDLASVSGVRPNAVTYAQFCTALSQARPATLVSGRKPRPANAPAGSIPARSAAALSVASNSAVRSEFAALMSPVRRNSATTQSGFGTGNRATSAGSGSIADRLSRYSHREEDEELKEEVPRIMVDANAVELPPVHTSVPVKERHLKELGQDVPGAVAIHVQQPRGGGHASGAGKASTASTASSALQHKNWRRVLNVITALNKMGATMEYVVTDGSTEHPSLTRKDRGPAHTTASAPEHLEAAEGDEGHQGLRVVPSTSGEAAGGGGMLQSSGLVPAPGLLPSKSEDSGGHERQKSTGSSGTGAADAGYTQEGIILTMWCEATANTTTVSDSQSHQDSDRDLAEEISSNIPDSEVCVD